VCAPSSKFEFGVRGLTFKDTPAYPPPPS